MVRYLLDENLTGKRAIEVLRAGGCDITTCHDLGLKGVRDDVWIPVAAKLGFVIITADVKMRRVPAEKAAILAARARVVAVRIHGNITTVDVAQNIINSRRVLERFVRKQEAPWMVTLALPSPKDFALGKAGRLTRHDLGKP